MEKSRLDPKIYEYLVDKTKDLVQKPSIRPAISRIRNKYPGLTLNAAAEVYAKKKGFTISRYLTDKDRETLRPIQFITIKTPSNKAKQKKGTKIIAKYETDNKLLISHLKEINKTYTNGCYTACFVLCRKVLENLIIHHIIRKKYPKTNEEHRKIYYNFDRGRYWDFSIIISNLRSKSNDFGPEKQLVERICQLADGFKDTANVMTHSLYHIARKKEMDDKNIQDILDLIKKLEETL